MTNTPTQDAALATVQAEFDASNRALAAETELATQVQAALAASQAAEANDEAALLAKDAAMAQVQAAYDAYRAEYPASTPTPPPVQTVAFGSAVNSSSVYDAAKADGVVIDAARVYLGPGDKLPASWSADKRLPSSGICVLSHKDVYSAAQIMAFAKTKPAAVTLYTSFKHEVENNITASYPLAKFRSDTVLQSAAWVAAGAIPGLILTGFATSDAGAKATGRTLDDYFVAGSHFWFAVDFYSDRDADAIIARTIAFAQAKNVAWGITEAGMATKNGTEAQRIAYAASIRAKALAASPKPFTVDWWTDTSNANFSNPLTPGVAKAFLDAA